MAKINQRNKFRKDRKATSKIGHLTKILVATFEEKHGISTKLLLNVSRTVDRKVLRSETENFTLNSISEQVIPINHIGSKWIRLNLLAE